MSCSRVMCAFGAAVVLVGCGPDVSGGGGGGGDCEENACGINGWSECRDGELQAPLPCEPEEVCLADLGCSACIPGAQFCVEDTIYECTADGAAGEPVQECGGNEVCSGGTCVTACEKAEMERSNIGCEYWAVDLDNEYSDFNDAAGEQFAVALANASGFPVSVVIEQNNAEPGQPLQLSTVAQVTVQPDSLEVINLPTREVDGSLQGMDEGPGTMLSSRAYRITTNYPVVAYQFNPIIQSFSNGASLLIPTSGLDNDYYVLGWSTANPIAGPFDIPGIPDHSFVTVVGVTEQPVNVQVTLGGDIVGGGPVAKTGEGGVVQASLGAFDVLNLESDGIPGDLTGTQVIANGPVAVFTGGERAIVPIDVMPPPPDDWDGELCCTEHFEQQAFPKSALGTQFVTTRSPIRSTNESNPEGDVWRVFATKPNTIVTTNLAAPFDRFELGQGEYAEFWSIEDFVLSSTEPVIVGQYLVSQQYVDRPEVGGDPEFILYPPAEQYRNEYLFLAPPTFDRDWAVIAAPSTAQVELDGVEVDGELGTGPCTRHPAGFIAGVDYVAIRCPLTDGVHRVRSNMPVGVTVYGYYNVGSYGYAAGAELERINID